MTPVSLLLPPLRWAVTALPLLLCLSVHLHAPWAAPARWRDAVLRDCAALGEAMAPGPPCPSVGRRLRLLEWLLWPLLVLLVSGLQPALGQKVYTNTWAVHIPGGQEEAQLVASKHGFINYGHVSNPIFFSSAFVMYFRKHSRWYAPHYILMMQTQDASASSIKRGWLLLDTMCIISDFVLLYPINGQMCYYLFI